MSMVLQHQRRRRVVVTKLSVGPPRSTLSGLASLFLVSSRKPHQRLSGTFIGKRAFPDKKPLGRVNPVPHVGRVVLAGGGRRADDARFLVTGPRRPRQNNSTPKPARRFLL